MTTCSQCSHSLQSPIDPLNVGAERQRVCTRNPPVPYPIPSGRGMSIISVRPVVQDGDKCGEWAMDTRSNVILPKET